MIYFLAVRHLPCNRSPSTDLIWLLFSTTQNHSGIWLILHYHLQLSHIAPQSWYAPDHFPGHLGFAVERDAVTISSTSNQHQQHVTSASSPHSDLITRPMSKKAINCFRIPQRKNRMGTVHLTLPPKSDYQCQVRVQYAPRLDKSEWWNMCQEVLCSLDPKEDFRHAASNLEQGCSTKKVKYQVASGK